MWASAVRIGDIVEGAVLALRPDSPAMVVQAACRTARDAAVLFGVLVVRSWKPSQGLKRALLHLSSVQYLIARVNMLPMLLPGGGHLRLDVLKGCIHASQRLAMFASPTEKRVLTEQRDAAVGMLQSLPALQSLDGSRGVAARKQVQKAVGLLQRLSESLTGTFTTALHREFVAFVLDAACRVLVNKVLALSDISEPDCTVIANLCDKLWKEPSQAVEANTGQSPAGKGSSSPEEFALMKLCKQGTRLQALSELLRIRMAEVVEAWQRGKYRAAGLSAAEVKQVVNAVFQDNEFRRSCLREIDSSS